MKPIFFDLMSLTIALKKEQVIAYPTESVFGLFCDPDSRIAVHEVLKLKQRPLQKGLILVAAHYAQLIDYINDDALNNFTRERMFASWPGPVTWVVPAKSTTPRWLIGKYSSLAVRVSGFEPLRKLCLMFGKPLVSTSANLTGLAPARTAKEVREKFKIDFPILNEKVGGDINPSEIRNALTNEVIRQG